ncbi:hypothetical protein SESBI_42014 [Sesbania bispinosa]|nr:hypothetical protein SESBI_42014 [Sesbania bispinosa]
MAQIDRHGEENDRVLVLAGWRSDMDTFDVHDGCGSKILLMLDMAVSLGRRIKEEGSYRNPSERKEEGSVVSRVVCKHALILELSYCCQSVVRKHALIVFRTPITIV